MKDFSKIHVLFITKWYMNRNDPQLGVFIRKHATAVASHCRVSLLCVLGDSKQSNRFAQEDTEEFGIRSTVIYFRKYTSRVPVLNSIVNLYRYLQGVRHGLKHILERSGPHHLTHAYILLRPALIAWWLRMTRGIPFVVSEQWSGYATGKFNQRSFLVRALSRRVIRSADGVTAVSNFLASKMKANGLNAAYLITPNVIEPVAASYVPIAQNESVKILTVADLVDEIKNISDTIRVAGAISAEGKQIELHIVGHGRDEQMLKTLAGQLGLLDRVVFFHGVKSNEEVFQYLHACDFLVMNSRFETFSLVCIEAMSCGKPVIATRCGGPEEFMTPALGILIDPDREDQLMQAVNRMISEYSKFDAGVLKSTALSRYSGEKAGELFLGMYREVLGG